MNEIEKIKFYVNLCEISLLISRKNIGLGCCWTKCWGRYLDTQEWM